MPARLTVAAFDFDGTLSRRDCVVPFLRRTAGTLRLSAGMLGPGGRALPPVLRRDRDALKAAAARVAFTGRRAEEIDDLGTSFAAFVEANWLRGDTLAALRAHLSDGHRVVIVSASLEPYLVPLGASLGVDAVLCTRLEVGADGLLTGRLLGKNCRGQEKVRRLATWLVDQRLDRGELELVAYGDSTGDVALLRVADRGFWAAGSTLAAWRSP